MPITWRGISLPPPLRRPVKRLRRRAALKIGSLRQNAFARLVTHFLVRLLRSGDSVSSDPQIGVGALLGLLAAPGAFQCFLMLDKYSSFMNWIRGRVHDDLLLTSVSDKYMFLSLAMAITGIVTTVKWERILPDSQDFLNLAPLPIAPRTLLSANVVAIAVAVIVVVTCVNGLSTVLFPLFVSAGSIGAPINAFSFIAVHALCVTLASAFAFCSVFALLGVVALVVSKHLFQGAASWLIGLLRGLLTVGFIGLLLSGFASPAIIRAIHQTPSSPLRMLPPIWFLALYQHLQHRPSPELTPLVPVGLDAVAIAFTLVVVSYALNYGRTFNAVLEGSSRSTGGRLLRVVLLFFDLFGYHEPGFRRACYRFTIRALLRNETQRFCLAVSVGLGWLFAVQSAWPSLADAEMRALMIPDTPILAAPLVAAYLLILGVRLSFELPSALPANWIFRSILDGREHDSIGIARRVVLAFLTALVLAPCLLLSLFSASPPVAVLETLYVFALSLCLTEIFLSGYRRIPFTCLQPGFRENLPVMFLLHVFAFLAFARVGAAFEHWILAEPIRFFIIPLAMGIAWFANRSRVKNAAEAGEIEAGLSFDSRAHPAVQRLNLLDSD